MKRVCILGGGTAGMAAAYALKDNKDIHLTVVEKESCLGGTAVNAWVNTWIAGVNPPYLQKIFEELKSVGKAAGDLGNSWLAQKHRKDGKSPSTLIFDVKGLAEKYHHDLSCSNVEILTEYEFERLEIVKRKGDFWNVSAIIIHDTNGGNEKVVEADFFIDCSGDGVLCRSINPVVDEDYYYGEDPQNRFGEVNAPRVGGHDHLNLPSLFYKIKLPLSVAVSSCSHVKKPSYITGDGYNINGYDFGSQQEDVVNPLSGQGLCASDALKDYNALYREAKKRCEEHWSYVRSELKAYVDAKNKPKNRECAGFPPGLYVYEYKECAPMLGIREGYRIHCEYMLRQKDLTERINSGNLKHYIACGGHTIDFHGSCGRNFSDFNNQVVVSGIPYECMVPKKTANVLIACRAFGASHIALAARRINKDMAQLGWAAGHAIGICAGKGYSDIRQVITNIAELQEITGFKSGVEYIEQFMI